MSNYIYLPVPYIHRNITIPNELIVDADVGSVYINNIKNIPQLGLNRIIKTVGSEFDNIIGDVDVKDVNLNSMYTRLIPILKWQEYITGTSDSIHVNTLDYIYPKLKDILYGNKTIKELFDNKFKKIYDKDLTDNNFTDDLFDKLNGIDFFANNFKHSDKKMCNYIPKVLSVNDKVGNVNIEPIDVGLDKLDPDANLFIHSDSILCNLKFVSSVNNKTGSVVLKKSDVGLKDLENYSIIEDDDIYNKSPNSYLSAIALSSIIANYNPVQYSTIRISEDGIIYGTPYSNYIIKKQNSYILRYSGKSTEVSCLSMFIKNKDHIVVVYPDNIVKICKLDLYTMVLSDVSSTSFKGTFGYIVKMSGTIPDIGYMIYSDIGINIGSGIKNISNRVLESNKTPDIGISEIYDNIIYSLKNDGYPVSNNIAFGSIKTSYDKQYCTISAGRGFSVALDVNGTIGVISYGDNRDILACPTGPGFISISAGESHCIALHKDGYIKVWGSGKIVDNVNRYSKLENISNVYTIGNRVVLLNNKKLSIVI